MFLEIFNVNVSFYGRPEQKLLRKTTKKIKWKKKTNNAG
jgi:hypothetical protein